MALNTLPNNMCDGSIQLKDATGSPITVTAQYSQGDLQISGLQQKQREVTAYEARGVITGLRHGARKNVSGSFTCQMTGLTNATAFAPDAVMKTGAFSAGVSVAGANADVWTTTIVWTVEGSDFGGADTTVTMTNCQISMDVSEGEPNTLSFSFTCYGTVTIA